MTHCVTWANMDMELHVNITINVCFYLPALGLQFKIAFLVESGFVSIFSQVFTCFCQMNSPGSTQHLSLSQHLSVFLHASLHLSLSPCLSPSFFIVIHLSLSFYISLPLFPRLCLTHTHTHTVSPPFCRDPCAAVSMKYLQKAKCSETGFAQRRYLSAITNTESVWSALGLPVPPLCRKQTCSKTVLFLMYHSHFPIPIRSNPVSILSALPMARQQDFSADRQSQ